MVDDFTAAFTYAAPAGAALSTLVPDALSSLREVDNFGVGMSGFADFASSANCTAPADTCTSAGAGAGDVGGVSNKGVLQQKTKSAVMIKDHLSCRRQGRVPVPATQVSLLYHRTGVTGPLVMFFIVLIHTLLPSPFLALPYHLCSDPHALRENCYNPAR